MPTTQDKLREAYHSIAKVQDSTGSYAPGDGTYQVWQGLLSSAQGILEQITDPSAKITISHPSAGSAEFDRDDLMFMVLMEQAKLLLSPNFERPYIQAGIEDMKKAHQFRPRNTRPILAIARGYAYLDDHKSALEWVDKALAIEPESYEAKQLRSSYGMDTLLKPKLKFHDKYAFPIVAFIVVASLVGGYFIGGLDGGLFALFGFGIAWLVNKWLTRRSIFNEALDIEYKRNQLEKNLRL